MKQFLSQFFSQLVSFVKNVANDTRIPARDKKTLVALVVLLVSPIDFIPDWIPVIGVLDDAIVLAVILDYLFNVLDSEILLTHYPWGMKSFIRMRKGAKFISLLAPDIVKKKIWAYVGSPYKNSPKA